MEKIKLYDQVNVYPNAIKNVKEHVKMLESSEFEVGGKYYFNEWQDWYGIGSMMNIGMLNENENPINSFLGNDHAEKQLQFMKDCKNAFFSSTKDYMEEYNIQLPDWNPKPNWQRSGLSVCRYDITKNPEHLALEYHTDTHEFDLESPGQKFAITCTMYLNDDYEGGEVSYLNEKEGEVVTWKPKAGDVIVFPSHSPFFHGVHAVSKNVRYLVRTWWFYDYAGSPEWHLNKEKYGESEWLEMERIRKDKEFHSGKWHRHVVYEGEEEVFGQKAIPFHVKRKRYV
jgi:2OG-Fe(II) oxygenase superfamily